ncbi:transglycosylase domain-containing protein [Luteolibacter sp. GHJ8]|uniref:peptidoglycan glycosyltransferase n=1 Tax=Luteolibacter rhizosphaerae TaxID=2989719 RepID=A0ABT3G9F5_9BACT|nr:transglycosylase domain-containing protein [Luteolibacter rhizosphaerae]MCW1916109.1 transglycosylase domain-containing protein [Luteolibacter rhizosphaerae]
MSSWRTTRKIPAWQSWMPEWLRTALRWGIWAVVICLVTLLVGAMYFFAEASRFDLAEVARMPARTTIFDRNGKEIGSAGGNNRRLVSRQDIPDFLVKALRAREDARFFEHSGVDVRGLLRATVRNVKDGDFTQGASTLSMQLARNTYGEEHKQLKAKSIHRKLLEIALTLRIENHYTKDQILAHYLNRIYFGSGCHGVDQAARTYFGKPVSELNEAESAMMVGIIRGPHIFSPFRNFKAAKEQQTQTLARMKAMKLIDAETVDLISNRPIKLVPSEQRTSERSYVLEAVQKELQDILDDEDIRDGGLVVKTTLDSGWQLRLETDLSESLRKIEQSKTWTYPVHANHEPGQTPAYLQCAAVTLETKTGAILGLVGGRDYLDSRFDRTIGARRDLGAAFEPWIAAAAAERGRIVLPGKPVQTGRQIGPKETARIAKRCGITGPFQESEDLFRGIAAATPLELATGLATLGNQGMRPKPFLIQSIATPDGKTVYQASSSLSPAIGKAAAKEAASLLENTGSTRVYGGATGSGRDAWLARLGPKGSTAIWVGFDQPQRISSAAQLDQVLSDLATRLGN